MTAKPSLSLDANTLLLEKYGYSNIKILSTTKLSSVYSCLNDNKEKVAIKIDNNISDMTQLFIMASFVHNGIIGLKKIIRHDMKLIIETQLGEYDYYRKIILDKHLPILLDALAALHENNIFHGDIKPSNMVKLDNSIKLIDFNTSSFLTGMNTYNNYGGGTKFYTSPAYEKGEKVDLQFDLWALAYSFLSSYVESSNKDKDSLKNSIKEAKESPYCSNNMSDFLKYVLLDGKDLNYIITQFKITRTPYSIKELTIKQGNYNKQVIKYNINKALCYIYVNYYWNSQPIKWLFDLVALIYSTYNGDYLQGMACANIIARRYPFTPKKYNTTNLSSNIKKLIGKNLQLDDQILDVIVRCQGLVTCGHLYYDCRTEEDYKQCFKAFFEPENYVKGVELYHEETDLSFLAYIEDYILDLLQK
jgi:serine/threonine protein kinase